MIDVELKLDPARCAEEAGLTYVSDEMPGIRRLRWGRGFTYRDAGGKTIKDEEERARLESLAIPPAWEDVWICPDPNGHILATGRDEKGRKVYLYHPRWREVRDAAKYNSLLLFGQRLPEIREKTDQDLRKHGLPREKVLAAVVRLLGTTFVRIGNLEYAKRNRTYGLTTLRDRHVDIKGSHVIFHFKGKSGKEHEIDLNDRRLARVVERCRDVPGYDLFQYYDEDGDRQTITSGDVNDYLREITGEEFSAKDFRTWGACVLALDALRTAGPEKTKTKAHKNTIAAVKEVAEQLGNTPAIARKSYIHPAILERYEDGSLFEILAALDETEDEDPYALRPEERALVKLLEHHITENGH